jgi:hypothetical protein
VNEVRRAFDQDLNASKIPPEIPEMTIGKSVKDDLQNNIANKIRPD